MRLISRRKVYCGMDIGTAKVSAEDRARIPHHMLDHYSIDHVFSAGAFAEQSVLAIRDIANRGRTPIVVGARRDIIIISVGVDIYTGGTAFYIRMLMNGSPGTPSATADTKAQVP